LHSGHLEHEEGGKIFLIYISVILLLRGHHVGYSLQIIIGSKPTQ